MERAWPDAGRLRGRQDAFVCPHNINNRLSEGISNRCKAGTFETCTFCTLLIIHYENDLQISRLCQAQATQNELLGITEAKLRPITKRTYCAMSLLYILYALAVVVSYPYCSEILETNIPSEMYKIQFKCIWVLLIATFYWPFPAVVSFLMNRQCLLTLMTQLEEFQAKIAKPKGNVTPS